MMLAIMRIFGWVLVEPTDPEGEALRAIVGKRPAGAAWCGTCLRWEARNAKHADPPQNLLAFALWSLALPLLVVGMWCVRRGMLAQARYLVDTDQGYSDGRRGS
jgi:hypothetical protein